MQNRTQRELVEDGLERVEDAAAFLQISRASMREIIRRREIKIVRIGRSVRVPRRALIAFAASRVA
jgi:excisionase family DNA binding protein